MLLLLLFEDGESSVHQQIYTQTYCRADEYPCIHKIMLNQHASHVQYKVTASGKCWHFWKTVIKNKGKLNLTCTDGNTDVKKQSPGESWITHLQMPLLTAVQIVKGRKNWWKTNCLLVHATDSASFLFFPQGFSLLLHASVVFCRRHFLAFEQWCDLDKSCVMTVPIFILFFIFINCG